MPDHVHMLIWIPPKYAVSSVVGYIKGKSAIHVSRHFMKRGQNYAGQSLWARGYFVDSVGRDTEVIRKYTRFRFLKQVGTVNAIGCNYWSKYFANFILEFHLPTYM